MINFIQGKVVQKEENLLVVENNGIGYEILVSSHTSNSISFLNEEVKVLTYMQVREDGISLFGFVKIVFASFIISLVLLNCSYG